MEQEPPKEEGIVLSRGLKLQSILGWDMATKAPSQQRRQESEKGECQYLPGILIQSRTPAFGMVSFLLK